MEKKEKEEELKADTKPPEQTEWDKIKMENPELKDVIGEPKEETKGEITGETMEESKGEITGEKMTNMRNLEGMRSLF